MTINDWVSIWIDTYKKPFVGSATLDTIYYCLRHILSAFDRRNMTEIKGFEIQQFLNSLKNIPNMQDKVSKYINDIFEYAYRNQIIDFNPVLAVKLKKYNCINTPFFDLETRQYFLDSIKGKNYELLYIAYLCTGARKSEIIGNNYLEVDLSRKIVHIKGTKTANADRYVPLFDKLRLALELVPDYKSYFEKYTSDYAYLCLKRHLKRIGLPEYSVRSLRSTFSNMCYSVGVREKTISAWLGHSGKSTVSKYYLNNDSISKSASGQIAIEIELVNSIL